MKLSSFTFHPHPIQVDGRPLHGVRIGDGDVTDIQLHEGVLIVSRGAQVWFTHTSYGTGVPVDKRSQVDSAWQRAIKADVNLPAELAAEPGFGTVPKPVKQPRSKKQ